MTIKLSRCQCSISTTEGMELINSLIKDTPIYEKYRECKIKNAYVSRDIDSVNGFVGHGCWWNFKRRNSNRTVSKKGEKFELDRQHWCKYRNFNLMCC